MYPEMLKAVMLIDSTSFNWKKLYELDNPILNDIISIEKMSKNYLKEGKMIIGNENLIYLEGKLLDTKMYGENFKLSYRNSHHKVN